MTLIDPFLYPYPLRIFDPEAKSYHEWIEHDLSLRRQWSALQNEEPTIEGAPRLDLGGGALFRHTVT